VLLGSLARAVSKGFRKSTTRTTKNKRLGLINLAVPLGKGCGTDEIGGSTTIGYKLGADFRCFVSNGNIGIGRSVLPAVHCAERVYPQMSEVWGEAKKPKAPFWRVETFGGV
jgi:hypothetical protein